jgi:GNAT superfamily N-acetyltransferase
MGGVEVRAIQHPRDTKEFVRTWWRVYRDDPCWVPPLLFERKRFFDPRKNPYFKYADVQCFLATRDGEALGTIAATVDHQYQEHDPGAAFFGFFEFVDDLEVARALLDAACDWLRGRGMTKVIGPFNLNSNHEFALLVDGFETDPFIANPHNSAYFAPIYEKLGLRKVMDWYAYEIDLKSDKVSRMRKVASRLLSRNPEIKLRNLDMKNFERDILLLHQIYDDAWEHNWGHVRVSREEFLYLANGFKMAIDPSLCFVAEVAGEVAGISVSFPNLNPVVKSLNGRILPFGWLKLLRGGRGLKNFRVFMLGIAQKHQNLPLGAPLYAATWDRALKLGMDVAEASLILEDNFRMRQALEKMGGVIHKTYRHYELDLR